MEIDESTPDVTWLGEGCVKCPQLTFPVRAGSGHKVDIRRGRPSLAGANVHSEGVDLIVKPNREPDAMQPRALVAGTLGQLGSRKRDRRARDEDQSPPYPTRAALARSRTPAAQLR